MLVSQNIFQLDTCSICLEKFKTNIAVLPCGHIFDRDCIQQWLSEHITCPLDRKLIQKNQIKYFTKYNDIEIFNRINQCAIESFNFTNRENSENINFLKFFEYDYATETVENQTAYIRKCLEIPIRSYLFPYMWKKVNEISASAKLRNLKTIIIQCEELFQFFLYKVLFRTYEEVPGCYLATAMYDLKSIIKESKLIANKFIQDIDSFHLTVQNIKLPDVTFLNNRLLCNLKLFPNIESIEYNTNYCNITSVLTPNKILVHLSHLRHLKELRLGGCVSLSDDEVLTFVTKCSSIKVLDLKFCERLTDLSIKYVAQHLTEIQELHITGTERITGEGLIHLCICNNLKILNLSGCKRLKMEHFPRLASLEVLNLEELKLADKDLTLLFSKAPNLKKLFISKNKRITVELSSSIKIYYSNL